jgi:predicted enzyme related to lactoylglutathione lyase
MSHTIIHFEIPADDVEKAKRFYEQVFGWKIVNVPQMDYSVIHTVPTDEKGMLKEPGVNGGLYKRTDSKQVPINYIHVESVDEYIEKVVQYGGKILAPKQYIPHVGDIAWATDPEGNPFGLIRPEM